MIVIDTNVISFLFLDSGLSDEADRAQQRDSDWAAPFLWRSEFQNVLSLYVRKEIIGLQDAQLIMGNALSLMYDREYEVASYEVLRLSASSGCSAYDCEFIVTANDLKVPLVTVDQKLLNEFPAVAVSLIKFCG